MQAKYYLAVLALGLAVGCSKGPARLVPPSIDADAAGAAALQQYDANHDGRIAGAELDKVPALAYMLSDIRSDRTKGVTGQQIADHIRKWQATKVARTTVSPRITLNGKPLGGAKITFVPEKFLGGEIPTCTGETESNGTAVMTVPNSDAPGIPCGFYRVEVRSADPKLVPEKYNTATTLGAEVSPTSRSGDTFDFALTTGAAAKPK